MLSEFFCALPSGPTTRKEVHPPVLESPFPRSIVNETRNRFKVAFKCFNRYTFQEVVRANLGELLVDGRKSGFRGQAVFDNAVRLMETQSEEFEGDRDACQSGAAGGMGSQQIQCLTLSVIVQMRKRRVIVSLLFLCSIAVFVSLLVVWPKLRVSYYHWKLQNRPEFFVDIAGDPTPIQREALLKYLATDESGPAIMQVIMNALASGTKLDLEETNYFEHPEIIERAVFKFDWHMLVFEFNGGVGGVMSPEPNLPLQLLLLLAPQAAPAYRRFQLVYERGSRFRVERTSDEEGGAPQ